MWLVLLNLGALDPIGLRFKSGLRWVGPQLRAGFNKSLLDHEYLDMGGYQNIFLVNAFAVVSHFQPADLDR